MTNPSPSWELESLPPCTCRSGATFFRVMMMALLMGLLASAVITYAMPKKYESKAVIQVNPSTRIRGCFFGAGASHTPMSPTQFNTELEIFRSQKTVKKVVQKLNLTARWGISEENALDTLRKMIDVKSISGTDLIEVTVRHTNPQETREIAQEIYEAYKKHHEEIDRHLLAEGMHELEKAIQDQADLVEEKRKLRDNHMKRAINAHKARADQNNSFEKSREEEGKQLNVSPIAGIAPFQREFEMQQEMLDRMREKLAMDRMIATHPFDRIKLHQEPLVALYPFSPNPALNLFIGAGAGLALGLLIVLTMELFQESCRRCAAA